jgi:hypothetical protein
VEEYPGQIKALEEDFEAAKRNVQREKNSIDQSLRRMLDFQKMVGYLETRLSLLKDKKTGGR